MKVQLKDRLSAMKARRKMTTDALSAASGVPKGTLNKLLNGETRNPTVGTLRALARALDCPLEALSGETPPEQIPGVHRLSEDMPRARNARDILPVRRRQVPLLGTIAAGEPIYAEQSVETVDCDAAMHCDFALRVRGQSMIGARIRDGDTVFIRRQDDVADGQIAAVIVDGEATLKRVYHVRNGLQLLSENPDFPPMLFTLDEVGSIRILGRAVGFCSRL